MPDPPPGIDATKAEPVGFTQERPLKTKLTLDDGTVMEVEIPMGTVFRSPAYNPADGMPIYMVQVAQQPMVRFLKVPPEMRKKGFPWVGGK